MTKSTRLILTTAALAGLYAGSLATKSFAAEEKAGKEEKAKADTGKHDCKGKNACKGHGVSMLTKTACAKAGGTVN